MLHTYWQISTPSVVMAPDFTFNRKAPMRFSCVLCFAVLQFCKTEWCFEWQVNFTPFKDVNYSNEFKVNYDDVCKQTSALLFTEAPEESVSYITTNALRH